MEKVAFLAMLFGACLAMISPLFAPLGYLSLILLIIGGAGFLAGGIYLSFD